MMVMEATQCATCGTPTYSTCHDCRELACGHCLITHECGVSNVVWPDPYDDLDDEDEVIVFPPATNDTDEENTTVPAPPETNPESDQEVQEGVGSLAQCSGLVAGEETK